MLIGLASQAIAAACRLRSRASACAFFAASPRFSIAALRSFGIAAFTASISDGSVASASAAIADVDRLEALEVLVVRLGVELDRVDADQLGVGLDPGLVEADAVLAVVDVAVHHGPEVGQLHADDDVGVGDRRRAGAEMVRLREVHAAAHVDDARLQRLGELHEQPTPFSVRAARSTTITGRSALASSRAASLTAPVSPCGGEVGVYFGM